MLRELLLIFCYSLLDFFLFIYIFKTKVEVKYYSVACFSRYVINGFYINDICIIFGGFIIFHCEYSIAYLTISYYKLIMFWNFSLDTKLWWMSSCVSWQSSWVLLYKLCTAELQRCHLQHYKWGFDFHWHIWLYVEGIFFNDLA